MPTELVVIWVLAMLVSPPLFSVGLILALTSALIIMQLAMAGNASMLAAGAGVGCVLLGVSTPWWDVRRVYNRQRKMLPGTRRQ